MADPTAADPSAPAPDDTSTDGQTTDNSSTDNAEEAEQHVLATILLNADGTFQLIQGDEPEPGEEAGAEAGAGEGAGEAEPAPPGTSYDSPGKLLKALLDILNNAQSSGGDEEFNAGFAGGSNASPSKAAPMAA